MVLPNLFLPVRKFASTKLKCILVYDTTRVCETVVQQSFVFHIPKYKKEWNCKI